MKKRLFYLGLYFSTSFVYTAITLFLSVMYNKQESLMPTISNAYYICYANACISMWF